MTIGQRLLELRKREKLSQEEVAEKLNVTRQTISKWETDQSTPDFDKIVPLCNLFDITTDELLKGEARGKKEESPADPMTIKIGNAKAISISIMMYIIALVWIMVSMNYFNIDGMLSVSIFLLLIGVTTVYLVYHFMTNPDMVQTEKERQENKFIKRINSIISTICLIIYLLTSFITWAWHITWIIWIINGLLEELVKLIFMLKGEDVLDEE